MKAVIVLLTLVATLVNGLRNSNYTRTNPLIVGGSPAPVGFAPYQASLRTETHEHHCGGSILNSRWLLTAAQCIIDVIPVTHAVVGTNKLDRGGTNYTIKVRARHPGYEFFTTQEHDIALLKTWKDIAFSTLVKPINLPGNDISSGQTVTLTGWGEISGSSVTFPNDLQYTNVVVLSENDCKSRIPPIGLDYKVFSTSLCTLKIGAGGCSGDAGGPLVSNGVQYGIASWIVESCDNNYPDVATRLSKYGSWIWWTQHNNKWA